jgi:hypothetical protein
VYRAHYRSAVPCTLPVTGIRDAASLFEFALLQVGNLHLVSTTDTAVQKHIH